MRMCQGNPAPSDQGWSEAFELREMYGSEWKVYVKNNDPNGRYINIKIVSKDRVENKANYWLSWDNDKNRVTSRGMDCKLLMEKRPDLFAFVKRNMEQL